MDTARDVRFEGVHCTIVIRRPSAGIVLLVIEGTDTGELGTAPFDELSSDLRGPPIELFIDARSTRGASIHVSADWAAWLARHRAHFLHVSMLTGSRFIQLTADFVRRFAELGETMRIYTSVSAFEGALSHATAGRC